MTPEEIKSKIAELHAKYEEISPAYDELDAAFEGIRTNPALDDATRDAFVAAKQKLVDKRKALKEEIQALKDELAKTPEEPKKDPENPEDPKQPERDPNQIYASVGAGGKNDPLDVTLVQKLLNQRHNAKLSEDGKSGKGTVSAIKNFQRCINGNWNACDGRVDVGGKTWKWLSGNQTIPALPPKPPVPPVPVPPPPGPKPAPTPIPNPNVDPSTIKDILKYFIDNYGQYGPQEIFSMESPKLSWNLGFVKASVYAGLSSTASIVSKLEKNTISSTATIDLTGSIYLGVSAGITIGDADAWYSAYSGLDISASATAQLYASLTASTTASLTAQNGEIIGSLHSTGAELRCGVKLAIACNATATAVYFFSWDKSEAAAQYVQKWFGGSINGNTVTYDLGSIGLFEIKFPNFSLAFNIKTAKFKASKQGSFSYGWHKDIKSLFLEKKAGS